MAKERIGYPTQKPEPLLERVIQASSEPDDIILDAFIGGGTTAAVTQRLGRRWIAIDQSRVAIAVTTERLKQGVASAQFSTDVAPPPPSPHTSDEVPDFTVEQWGIYEAQKLSSMPSDDFQQFVLRSYGVTRLNDGDDGPHIHAWPINGQYGWGEPGLASQVSADDVRNFANADPSHYAVSRRESPRRNDAGVGLPSRRAHACGHTTTTRASSTSISSGLHQIRIGDPEFREHIVGRSTERADYSGIPDLCTASASGSCLPIARKPLRDFRRWATVWSLTLEPRSSTFSGTSITATALKLPKATRSSGTRKQKPQLTVTHKFDRPGTFNGRMSGSGQQGRRRHRRSRGRG